MMNGFELFDIRAWMTDGLLTQHVKRPSGRHVRKQRDTTIRARVVVPIATAVAACHLFSPAASAQPSSRAEVTLRWDTSSEIDQDIVPGDPKIYWAQLISTIQSSRTAPESQQVDPDPLF